MLRKLGWLIALVLIIPASLFAILWLALSLAGLYMLTVGGVPPGEPIYVDELAPSLGGATLGLALSSVTLVSLLWAWGHARRGWLRAVEGSSSAPSRVHGG